MPLSFKTHKVPTLRRVRTHGEKPSQTFHEMKVLDFDLENRPLAYWYDGNTTGEITAIGWSWIGEPEVEVLLLHQDGTYEDDEGVRYPVEEALSQFVDVLDEADMVTGHYIRRHDLPTLSAALIEYGLPKLSPLLTQDTQRDLVKRKDLSASQENLAAMFELPEPKHHMTQKEWREANRLTEAGIAAARKRVTKDVIQHKALREALIERGLLTAPKMWRP